eukprot:7693-Heterococcus_DN1.PRE.1
MGILSYSSKLGPYALRAMLREPVPCADKECTMHSSVELAQQDDKCSELSSFSCQTQQQRHWYNSAKEQPEAVTIGSKLALCSAAAAAAEQEPAVAATEAAPFCESNAQCTAPHEGSGGSSSGAMWEAS